MGHPGSVKATPHHARTLSVFYGGQLVSNIESFSTALEPNSVRSHHHVTPEYLQVEMVLHPLETRLPVLLDEWFIDGTSSEEFRRTETTTPHRRRRNLQTRKSDIKLRTMKNNLDAVVLPQLFADEQRPLLPDPRDDAVETRGGLTRSKGRRSVGSRHGGAEQLGEVAVAEAHGVPSGDGQTIVLDQIAGTAPDRLFVV